MDALVTIALEAAFFAVFAAVVVRYVRRPSRLNRDVLAVFGSVAGLFLLTIVSQLFGQTRALSAGAGVLLVAQPYLTVRLVAHFGRVPRALSLAALAGFLVAAALVIIGIQGNAAGLLFVVGYFVTTSTIAAAQFVAAGRARVGAARSRLWIAGVATFLFGAAVLVAAIGTATAPRDATGVTVLATAGRVIALAAGLGYLLAFAPPRWLRRIQQQAIAFELNQELLAVPAGSDAGVLWTKLAAAARGVTGGRASVVVGTGPNATILAEDGAWIDRPEIGSTIGRVSALPEDDAPAVLSATPEALADLERSSRADTTIVVPLHGAGGPRGDLVVFVAGSLLFVDDDLALLSILASRTLAAVEREEALADRFALVNTLQRTNDELARASAAKSDFLAAMSHELRTPLNSIIGFSELLMAPIQGDDGRRGLEQVDQAGHIHAAGLELLDLINEVLDLSRIEAGRLDLHYERFDLAALIRRTVQSMTPLADRRSVTLQAMFTSELEVEADPGRVRQVVYNLLSNAIKFSPEGGVVRVSVDGLVDDAMVRVEDEGPGIPASEQGLVFEAFAQGETGRGHADGAGLGLALSRRLAEAHGGGIDLESEPGRGSAFTLRLPARRPEAPAAEVRDGRRLVLVIEDEPSSVALLRTWLEPEGYAVTVAATGEAGLEMARTLAPDAILLDILLPGVDGWEVLQQLRVDRRTREIPILVVSVVEDQQLGMALGAADYFVKPVDREHLLERLRWVTRARASDDPLVVLAIDQDAQAHRAYRTALAGAGQLVEARNASEARRLAVDARPDVILLDLALRDESPFALLAEFRAQPGTRHVPIFAVTARPLSDDDKRRLNGQVVAILEKGDAAGGLAGWLLGLPDPRPTRAAVPS